MEGIFKNTYFGKPYKTRDGRKAIYIGISHKKYGEDEIITILDENFSFHIVKLDGLCKSLCTCPSDIVSEWQEPVNEEILDIITLENYYDLLPDADEDIDYTKLVSNAFKAGYRKAMGLREGMKAKEEHNIHVTSQHLDEIFRRCKGVFPCHALSYEDWCRCILAVEE